MHEIEVLFPFFSLSTILIERNFVENLGLQIRVIAPFFQLVKIRSRPFVCLQVDFLHFCALCLKEFIFLPKRLSFVFLFAVRLLFRLLRKSATYNKYICWCHEVPF